MFQPFDAVILQRILKGTVELLRKDGLQRFVDERRLAAAGNTGHTNQFAKRKLHVYILQVIAFGTAQPQAMPVAFTAFGRYFDSTFTIEVLRGQGMCLQHFGRSAGKYDFTTQASRLRSHIDDVIGSQHHVLVMFHYNHGVADVAQLLQRMDKALVIALMQADTRFIQNIKHIDQLRTNLRSQADALTLSTGKADGTAVQR